ncbi:septum formation initiator family protein [Chloroflexus sp.]|uniref:septum formation initiator family protein n=1 Tax=Chloroflexus sp. TaxID=1904827 RepID=UPI002ACE9BD6|nr:septum formation initiator family protein [Chloroflexus sp.]
MLRGRVRRWLAVTFPGGGRTLISLALIALLLIMTGGMAVNLVNQIVIARHLERELAAASAQVAGLQATTQSLKARLEYERSDAAAEEWARALGLAREGDIVIVPERVPEVAPATAPVATPSPVPLPPPPNWQRWWQAFFP